MDQTNYAVALSWTITSLDVPRNICKSMGVGKGSIFVESSDKHTAIMI